MKSLKLILIALGLTTIFSSCDKVENIYPETYQTDLDQSLYPGTWQDYLDNEWPDFSSITASTDRNALVEDFTGHNCAYCPAAAVKVHEVQQLNPDRVFPAAIHVSPDGATGFQYVTSSYPVDFTNETGINIGVFFGQLQNQVWSGFNANPKVGVNRTQRSVGTTRYYSQGYLTTEVPLILNSTLKVAIKSKVNYFTETKGAFLHVEVEKLDATITNDLGVIVYLIEDSLVSPQNVSGILDANYVHRDIHRKNISGLTWGRTLTDELLVDGKHRLDYSFVVPNQLAPQGSTGTHNADNMHLLIYVYDKVTYEVYQVVKEKFV